MQWNNPEPTPTRPPPTPIQPSSCLSICLQARPAPPTLSSNPSSLITFTLVGVSALTRRRRRWDCRLFWSSCLCIQDHMWPRCNWKWKMLVVKSEIDTGKSHTDKHKLAQATVLSFFFNPLCFWWIHQEEAHNSNRAAPLLRWRSWKLKSDCVTGPIRLISEARG